MRSLQQLLKRGAVKLQISKLEHHSLHHVLKQRRWDSHEDLPDLYAPEKVGCCVLLNKTLIFLYGYMVISRAAVTCTYLCGMLGPKAGLETCSFLKDELLQCLFG